MSLTPRLDRIDRNYLINGNFDYWQRISGNQLTVTTNRAFGADRWMLFPSVTNSQASQMIRAASANGFSTYDMNFGPWNQNAKCAVAQIVEHNNTRELRGQTVTLNYFHKATNAGSNARIQILSWTGTADAVTGFSNAVPYTEWTNYTLASNFTSLGFINRSSAVANAYEEVKLTVNVPTNCNNLIVVIAYADNAGIQQFISQAKLAIGSEATDYSYFNETLSAELTACQRYFQTLESIPSVYSATNRINGYCPLPVHMRVIPTASMTGVINFQGTNAFNITQTAPGFANVSGMTSKAFFAEFANVPAGPAQGYGFVSAIAQNNSNVVTLDAEI